VRPAILFSVDLLQDLEDLDEEVDDVQIELDGGHDVLLGTQTGHDHLGVVNDEQGEEKGSPHCHGCVCQLVPEEDLKKPSQDQNEQAGVEDSPHIGEIPLSLEGEGSETNDHRSGEEECLDDNALVKECDQHSNSVSFYNSEGSEEDQVDGGLLPLDVESNQKSNGKKKSRQQDPGVGLKCDCETSRSAYYAEFVGPEPTPSLRG